MGRTPLYVYVTSLNVIVISLFRTRIQHVAADNNNGCSPIRYAREPGVPLFNPRASHFRER